MDAAALAQLLHDVRKSDVPCPVVLSEHEKKKGRRTTSKPGQIPTVAEYCTSSDLADVVTLFAATGCRIGELLGIRWEDVDLEAKSVTICGKINRIRGRGLIREDTTKSEAGMRTLPLPGVRGGDVARAAAADGDGVPVRGPTHSGTRTRSRSSGGRCARRSGWTG